MMICKHSEPSKVSVSEATLRYLELYTNNLTFSVKNLV
jgi:ribosomal protein L23